MPRLKLVPSDARQNIDVVRKENSKLRQRVRKLEHQLDQLVKQQSEEESYVPEKGNTGKDPGDSTPF